MISKLGWCLGVSILFIFLEYNVFGSKGKGIEVYILFWVVFLIQEEKKTLYIHILLSMDLLLLIILYTHNIYL